MGNRTSDRRSTAFRGISRAGRYPLAITTVDRRRMVCVARSAEELRKHHDRRYSMETDRTRLTLGDIQSAHARRRI